jgi:hypothetical protein
LIPTKIENLGSGKQICVGRKFYALFGKSSGGNFEGLLKQKNLEGF